MLCHRKRYLELARRGSWISPVRQNGHNRRPPITNPTSQSLSFHNISFPFSTTYSSQWSYAINQLKLSQNIRGIGVDNDHNNSIHDSLSKKHDLHQKRFMGRKDGHKAFYKARPPTRKQNKRYHKRKREQHYQQVGRHSKPGSKAGPRREYLAKEHEFQLNRARGLLDEAPDPDELEYDFGDAIIDDLIGNTKYLTSVETPEPTYIGHLYEQNYTIVSNLMKHFLSHQEREVEEKSSEDKSQTISSYSKSSLPSDADISSLLRSYRDKYSTKQKSLGIARALNLLLNDLKIPTAAFGEYTYTTLMTCSSSPAEAQRIMKMMSDENHPISSYSYSILLDVHAKRGDFRGADKVLSEMKRLCDMEDIDSKVEPTLPAYTSLLAACYKAINTGATPTTIKSEAGVLAWERWKEMRIRGLDADVMAYGAIIRIMAARGLAERAINLVEEMETFEVKPTTLIFSSALRAVARSHANALRYQGGSSKRDKRRQRVAAHHGKMTRQIVIMAENADVDQNDDGYTSALMLCAATAGDTATTKAIYMASEVRKLDFLRPIGDTKPLTLDSGTSDDSLLSSTLLGGGDDRLVPIDTDGKTDVVPSYGEREYGNDTRKLSALLHANASAIDECGIGDIWAGSENKGFLCENSLRLIVARQKPKYVDKSIPGIDSTDLTNIDWQEDETDEMSKHERRKPFVGFGDLDRNNTIDDLDPEIHDMILGDDYDDGNDDIIDPLTGMKLDELQFDIKDEANEEEVEDRVRTGSSNLSDADYIEKNLRMHEKNEGNEDKLNSAMSSGISKEDSVDPVKSVEDFAATVHDLQSLEQDGHKIDVVATKNNQDNDGDRSHQAFSEMISRMGDSGNGNNNLPNELENFSKLFNESEEEMPNDIQQFLTQMKRIEDSGDNDESFNESELDFIQKNLLGESPTLDIPDDMEQFDEFLASIDEENNINDDSDAEILEKKPSGNGLRRNNHEPTDEDIVHHEMNQDMKNIGEISEFSNQPLDEANALRIDDLGNQQLAISSISSDLPSTQHDELDLLLEGFPEKRVQKIRKAFKRTLGTPSMLTLVPILRENMPDVVNKKWLRTKNVRDACFVIQKAEEDKTIDVHLMNSMLKVYAKAGRINLALDYYESFANSGIVSTSYSDRIIVEMLIKNKRLSRALKFKEQVEQHGNQLDLLSYGSLIHHLGSRGQLGSALLLLKECITVTGSPPGEKYVKDIRNLCRDKALEEKVELEKMIGKDPMEWLREGEAIFKREYGKKGRHTVQLVKDRFISI